MTAEEELQGGIRNAVDRGVPIENVIKTFINAGYPEQAVRAAATAASSGLPLPYQSKAPAPVVPQQKIEQPSSQSNLPAPVSTQYQAPPANITVPQVQNQEQGPSKTKVYFLVAVLILLLIMLGASILFREQLTSLIS